MMTTDEPIGLVLDPPDCETSIRRMTTATPMSPWCPWDADDSSFNVKEALGSREAMPLSEVRDRVAKQMDVRRIGAKRVQLLADMYIRAALDHPSSAYALEFKHPDKTVTRLYRGEYTAYNRRGAVIGRWADESTPEPGPWFDNAMLAEHVIESGIHVRSLDHLRRLVAHLRRAS